MLIKCNKPTSPSSKWTYELGSIAIDDWHIYNLILNDLKEVKLKEFQYNINSRILVTKPFLYRINKTENDICSFCQQESEIISHLFSIVQKQLNFGTV